VVPGSAADPVLTRPDLREACPNWGGGATNAAAIASSPRDQLVAARRVFSDPLAFRRRDEVDALTHQAQADGARAWASDHP